MTQQNSPERAARMALRAYAQYTREPGFTPSPRRRRRSTRGQVGESWRTKKWTASRLRDRAEAGR